MLAGLPLTVPEDLIDFQHSAEAVAQLLKRKGFTVVKLFANRLYDSSFDKAAVLAEVKKTFLQVDVSGTALFAYVGHMSAGYYTYQQEVQISNEGTAVEKGKNCMQSRSSNTSKVHIITYAGEFERSKKGQIFTSDSTGISLQDILRVWRASLDQADGRSKSANLLMYLDSCFSGVWATQLAKKKHWYVLALIHAMFKDQGSHYNMVDWAGSNVHGLQDH